MVSLVIEVEERGIGFGPLDVGFLIGKASIRLNSKMLNRSVFLPILLFIYFCLAAPHKREFKIFSFLSEFHYLGLEKKLNDVSLNMIEILNFRFLILNP